MKKNIFLVVSILLLFSCVKLNAQQQELYTFCFKTTKAYLLDTTATSLTAPVGSAYKTWTLSAQTSYSAYLLSGDTILQTVAYTVTGAPGQGGTTGKVRKIRWDGTTVWEYAVATSTTHMHHDVCGLPNGNVLLIVYETKTAADATAKGCSSPPSSGIWSEKIIEVKPTGVGTVSANWGGTVVWEWHLWDHLCQNVNSGITSTYVSSVAQHPELMNVNYGMQQDWFHMNGIDYNPTLNQIILSSHYKNECYVIDHSTTTTEAATHSGGNSGKGGDFLYRWGNPAAYGCTAGGNNSGFNVIHDAHWIPANHPTYPNWMCAYNNNQGGTGVQVVMWNPPYNGYNYTYNPGSIIGPTTCTKPTIPTFTAADMGNSQQLLNGNMLVANPNGSTYEVSPTGTTLQTITSASSKHSYRYSKCYVRGPVATATASVVTACVGDALTLNATALSVTETSPTYTYSWSSSPSGFSSTVQNPTITPSSAGNSTYVVTITNTAIGCWDTASVHVTVSPCTDIDEISVTKNEVTVFPNPTNGILHLNDDIAQNSSFEVVVSDSYGKTIVREKNNRSIDLSGYTDGIYYVAILFENNDVVYKKIILIK
jgi:hypothetical protein